MKTSTKLYLLLGVILLANSVAGEYDVECRIDGVQTFDGICPDSITGDVYCYHTNAEGSLDEALCDVDCAGDMGGLAVLDCADECGGSAEEDCAGECNGDAVLDCNDECGGDAEEDCEGTCGGSADCGGDPPGDGGAPGGGGMWIHPPAEGVKKLCFAYSEADPGNMVQRVCGEGGPGEDGKGGEDGKDGKGGEDGKDGEDGDSKPDIESCWMIDEFRQGAAVPIADCPDQEDNRIHCYDEHGNPHSCPHHPTNWDYDSSPQGWAPQTHCVIQSYDHDNGRDTYTVTPIADCPTEMDFGDNPDPTKFNCFYHNNWFDTPEEYTVEIDMESGCSGVKGGHFNHDTKEWDAGCEDPSESLGFTGCYATNYSDEKYDGEEKGDPACPADGLCYLNSYDFEAGPVCCQPETLRREGLLPHCGVEMDFPGCYKFDKEEWDWYYMPNGEDCAEESKCFENSQDDYETYSEICCPKYVFRDWGPAGTMKSVLDPPTYCPDVHGIDEAYTAFGFDGCYIWNNKVYWGYYGVKSKFSTADLCPADGDGKCYKQDPRDPAGTVRPVCCPLEEVQVQEELLPYCGETLGMGAACYVDGKLYDDCMGEISMSPGHCYEGNYTGEDEDVLEYVAVCCSVKYYMEYGVSV